jgi:hypothetical protein
MRSRGYLGILSLAWALIFFLRVIERIRFMKLQMDGRTSYHSLVGDFVVPTRGGQAPKDE